MADIVSPEVRSRMMSGIRGKNTKPEVMVRSALHKLGYRYRLHAKEMPGKPDLALSKYKAVIFVHGCFWHGHDCHFFKLPSTRKDFWSSKIEGNRFRDIKSMERIEKVGWKSLVIWECALKGRNKGNFDQIIQQIANWLEKDSHSIEIEGNMPG